MATNLSINNRPGAGLPPWVRARMELLGVRPSLGCLAEALDIPPMTLSTNLRGVKEMRISTAKKLADYLKISTDEVITNLLKNPQ